MERDHTDFWNFKEGNKKDVVDLSNFKKNINWNKNGLRPYNLKNSRPIDEVNQHCAWLVGDR